MSKISDLRMKYVGRRVRLKKWQSYAWPTGAEGTIVAVERAGMPTLIFDLERNGKRRFVYSSSVEFIDE